MKNKNFDSNSKSRTIQFRFHKIIKPEIRNANGFYSNKPFHHIENRRGKIKHKNDRNEHIKIKIIDKEAIFQ
jgi:hypothetical protein